MAPGSRHIQQLNWGLPLMPSNGPLSCRLLHHASCRYLIQCHQPTILASIPYTSRCVRSCHPIGHHLVPCWRFVHLSHEDTYICGPFDFATIKGRKMRDHVSHAHWDILSHNMHMFCNTLPSMDLPVYSIHVDHTFHFTTTASFPSPNFPDGNTS